MRDLLPCAACGRHVYLGEPRCAFCDAAMPHAPANAARASRGVSRAVLYAMHAAVAGGIAAAACGGSSGGGSSSGTSGAPFACGTATCSGTQYCQQDCVRGGNPPPTCVDQPTCGATAPTGSQRTINCPCPPYGCVFPDACGATFV